MRERIDRTRHDRMTFRVDDENIAQLRQRVGQALEPLVVARLRQPDFLVADVADQLVDIDRRDLEGFEYFGGVLGDRSEGPLQAIFRLEKILMVGNNRADREDEERQNDRSAEQPPQRSLRAPVLRPVLSGVWG